MFRLLGLMISIGLADSINPSTIAPALYLSAGAHPRRQVTFFTISVFVVNLAAGALIAIGPGQFLHEEIADVHVQQTIRHAVEVAAGLGVIAAAVMVWRSRGSLGGRQLPQPKKRVHSSALLGVGIAALELPTAFPYFAAIAAILASGLGPINQLVLLIVFNLCFTLPLIAIVCVLTFAGDRAGEILSRWRRFLERRWPHITAGLLMIVGVVALLFGVTGLAAQSHNRVGRFFRHIRKALHLHP